MSKNLRTIEALSVAIEQLTAARDEVQKRHDDTLATTEQTSHRATFLEVVAAAGRAAATVIRALRR